MTFSAFGIKCRCSILNALRYSANDCKYYFKHLVQPFISREKKKSFVLFSLFSGYQFILAINFSIILNRMKNTRPQQDVCCISLY